MDTHNKEPNMKQWDNPLNVWQWTKNGWVRVWRQAADGRWVRA